MTELYAVGEEPRFTVCISAESKDALRMIDWCTSSVICVLLTGHESTEHKVSAMSDVKIAQRGCR